MLMNKKSLYFGVSLFSAIILGSVSSQSVKAATTDSSTAATPVTTQSQASTATTPTPTTDSKVSATATGTAADTTTPKTATSTTNAVSIVAATTNPSATGATATSSSSSTVSSTSTINIVKNPVAAPTASVAPGATSQTPSQPTPPVTSTDNTTNPYAIPSNVTDDTVVKFADPLLGDIVKNSFGLTPTQDLTVGEVKKILPNNVLISETNYLLRQNKTQTSMSDDQDTPIESLDGMQYLQLMPAKSTLSFQVDLAADNKANPDLRPLENIPLQSLTLSGNFSSPKGQQIDVNQLSNLDFSKATDLELNGDPKVSVNSGLNDQELKAVEPTLDKYADNGQSSHLIELTNSQITDFSPLQGTSTGNSVTAIASNDTIGIATPVYAVENQPISFTAPKIIGINGKDIADTYHFSYTVAKADLADDNLTNLGNDNYVLKTPDSSAAQLTYGHIGWAYSTNPDAYVAKTVGNTTFDTIITNVQPLIWQKNPTVTINYLDASGKPIEQNGQALTKVVAGTTIGSPYDLTADSEVEGYSLTSDAGLLKGSFTQNPQVVNLVFSQNPVQSAPSAETPVITPTTAPTKPQLVQVKMVDKNTTVGSNLAAIGVQGTTEVNGKLFYLSKGEYIAASDYEAVLPGAGQLKTFNKETTLFDSKGQPIKDVLTPNSGWKFDQIVAINGQAFYRVATDEYLSADESIVFKPVDAKSVVTVPSNTMLYNSQGQLLSQGLKAGSSWNTDGYVLINGVKMYRVATDAYVKADGIVATEPVSTIYQANQEVQLYDSQGTPIKETLPAKSAWKVDQVLYLHGQEYFRVGKDEYIKVQS